MSGKISVNQVKESLMNQCKKIHHTYIRILNCRLSKPIIGRSHYDILIYVQQVLSFSFLPDQAHWPNLIENESFSLHSTPSIPPQLCLLMKNVDIHIDSNEFCYELKMKFPAIANIVRMKNKFQNDSRRVKLGFTSSVIRDKLLLINVLL